MSSEKDFFNEASKLAGTAFGIMFEASKNASEGLKQHIDGLTGGICGNKAGYGGQEEDSLKNEVLALQEAIKSLKSENQALHSEVVQLKEQLNKLNSSSVSGSDNSASSNSGVFGSNSNVSTNADVANKTAKNKDSAKKAVKKTANTSKKNAEK